MSLLQVPLVQPKIFADRLQQYYPDLADMTDSRDESHVMEFIDEGVAVATHSS